MIDTFIPFYDTTQRCPGRRRALVVAMVEAMMAMVATVVLTLVPASTVARKGMLKYVLYRMKVLLIYQ
jgi:hypothetical protein